jgi:hypothetical protein
MLLSVSQSVCLCGCKYYPFVVILLLLQWFVCYVMLCYVMLCHIMSVKGKSISLQAWTGPEGSRKLRIPEGSHVENFFTRKIRRLRPGLNARTWVPEASLPTARPPKPLYDTLTLDSKSEKSFQFWNVVLWKDGGDQLDWCCEERRSITLSLGGEEHPTYTKIMEG